MKEAIQDLGKKIVNLERCYFNLGIYISFVFYDLVYFYVHLGEGP